jgi:hypothetical protein
MTIRRAGMPDETHVGAVRWEVGEEQGTALATVAIPDLNIAYSLLLGPHTDQRFPYLYGGFYLTLLGPEGPIPMGTFVWLSIGYATDDPTRPYQLLRVGQVALERTEVSVLAGFPRLAREMDVSLLGRATNMQLLFTQDGTMDNVIFVDFDLTENGRAALDRALPAWTGE